jgi:hypothetical protein
MFACILMACNNSDDLLQDTNLQGENEWTFHGGEGTEIPGGSSRTPNVIVGGTTRQSESEEYVSATDVDVGIVYTQEEVDRIESELREFEFEEMRRAIEEYYANRPAEAIEDDNFLEMLERINRLSEEQAALAAIEPEPEPITQSDVTIPQRVIEEPVMLKEVAGVDNYIMLWYDIQNDMRNYRGKRIEVTGVFRTDPERVLRYRELNFDERMGSGEKIELGFDLRGNFILPEENSWVEVIGLIDDNRLTGNDNRLIIQVISITVMNQRGQEVVSFEYNCGTMMGNTP